MTPSPAGCIKWLASQGWKVVKTGMQGMVDLEKRGKIVSFMSIESAYRRLGGPL